jgi:hypothetical protein
MKIKPKELIGEKQINRRVRIYYFAVQIMKLNLACNNNVVNGYILAAPAKQQALQHSPITNLRIQFQGFLEMKSTIIYISCISCVPSHMNIYFILNGRTLNSFGGCSAVSCFLQSYQFLNSDLSGCLYAFQLL